MVSHNIIELLQIHSDEKILLFSGNCPVLCHLMQLYRAFIIYLYYIQLETYICNSLQYQIRSWKVGFALYGYISDFINF